MELLTQSGHSLTETQLTIAKSLLRLKHHTEIALALQAVEQNTQASQQEVETVLKILKEYGILEVKSVEGRQTIEHNHPDRRHFHMVCLKTGQIEEFTSEILEEVLHETGARHGFVPVFSDIVLYGIKDEIIQSGQTGFSLVQAVQNQGVQILSFPDDEPEFLENAAKIGLQAGSHLEVLHQVESTGEILCRFQTHRLVIPKKKAEKILIRALNAEETRTLRTSLKEVEKVWPSLEDLKNGEEARIVRIRPGSPIQRRLMEMGFVAGASIKRLRIAPLGDPIEFSLRGAHVSLRRVEARDVFVERQA